MNERTSWKEEVEKKVERASGTEEESGAAARWTRFEGGCRCEMK